MEKVSGVVESKSKKGNSIKVNGEWYSVFSPADMPAEWKDDVDFLWEADKTGKYRNIKKGTIRVGGSGSVGGGGAPSAAGKPYSNLGVELGHASNVAKDMAIAKFPVEEIGGTEFYRWWIDETQNVYKMMKGLRAKFEDTPVPAPSLPKPVEELVLRTASPATVDDLF
jgi:hypothetical protein